MVGLCLRCVDSLQSSNKEGRLGNWYSKIKQEYQNYELMSTGPQVSNFCQSGYFYASCASKSWVKVVTFQYSQENTKIVDEEPLRRLCSDQYIFILFVYLLIMIGVLREVIYTRWLILVFLMTFFIYSSIMAQGGIIYWTHTRLHSLGLLGCWLHNNLNKNLALTL